MDAEAEGYVLDLSCRTFVCLYFQKILADFGEMFLGRRARPRKKLLNSGSDLYSCADSRSFFTRILYH